MKTACGLCLRLPIHLAAGVFMLLFIVSAHSDIEEVWRHDARAGAIAVPDGTNAVYVAYTTDGETVVSGVTVSNNGRGLLLGKYDDKGALLWLRQFGHGPSPNFNRHSAVISRIRLDVNKNIFVSGHIAGDSPTLIGTNSFLSPNFYGNPFIAKFDSEANLLWVRYVPGTDSADFNGLALDTAGNAFVCGQLYGTQTFGSIRVTGGGQSGFVARISSDGEWQWVNAAVPGGWAFAVAIDPRGDLLITGYTMSSAFSLFGVAMALPADPALTGDIIFVSKLDSRDGRAIWATGARTTPFYALSNIGRDIAVLSDGSAYIAGYYVGPAQFGSHTLPKTPDVALFLARISAGGEWLWATHGETQNQGISALYAVAVDRRNNAYVQGQTVNNFFYGSGTDGIIRLAGVNLTNTAFIARAGPDGKFTSVNRTRGLGNIQAVDFADYLYWGGDPGLVKFGPAVAPVIERQPASTNLVLTLNDATVVHVTAKGAPIYYQWLQNGVPLGNQNESRSTNGVHQITYTLAQFRAEQIGDYMLILSNSAGVAAGSTIHVALAPPQITGIFSTDGFPITNAEPDTTILIRGVNLEPAISLSLGLTKLEVSPRTPQEVVTRTPASYLAGPMTIVTPGGTASSTPFSVVLPPATSSGSSNLVGRPHYFYTPPAEGFSFQWFKDGVPLAADPRFSGAKTHRLTISSLEMNDSGVFSVVASAEGREVRSIDLPLTVHPEPPKPSDLSITGASFSSSLSAGQEATFSIVTTGDGPMIYQWFKDGVALMDGSRISGVTTDSLRILTTQPTDSGTYYAVVTVPAGSLTSRMMPLSVFAPLIVTGHPRDQVYTLGGTATFSVAATGNPPLIYQWKKGEAVLEDDGRMVGAMGATLTIRSLTTNDLGTYSIRVSDSAGSSTILEVKLTPPSPPIILQQPPSQTNLLGQAALFGVAALGGTSAPTYQWYKAGIPLPGQTNSSFMIFAVQRSDAGEYHVVVSNPGGSVMSAPAQLIVKTPEVLQIKSVVSIGASGFRLVFGYGDRSPIDPASLSRLSILTTTDLMMPPAQWQRLTNIIIRPDGQLELEDSAWLSRRFYLLQQQ